MIDDIALAQRAQDALEVVEPTLLYIQKQALSELLSIHPEQREQIDRCIAKAQVVQEVIACPEAHHGGRRDGQGPPRIGRPRHYGRLIRPNLPAASPDGSGDTPKVTDERTRCPCGERAADH
jgi:hypothetical protein